MKLSREELIQLKTISLEKAEIAPVCMLLDNNESINACGFHDIEFIFASGIRHEMKSEPGEHFEGLTRFKNLHPGEYIFGILTYDLKNEIEKLDSLHENQLQFPMMYFFIPELLVVVDDKNKILEGEEIAATWIMEQSSNRNSGKHPSVSLMARVNRDEYIKNVNAIREHIVEGDVYELNYCVEFYAESAQINPFQVYEKLKQKSPTPFGGFFRLQDQYLLCASPERFLKKQGERLYSQPIKGTTGRGKTPEEDEKLKTELANSEKEQAENLMIVDLVRNDLARSSKPGTVNVDELFGIYSFPQVHQMISTVSSLKDDRIDSATTIKNAFPMGSMTGAPKIKAMQLIEQYEQTKRGLYSGSIGYMAPGGDFDFNVIIRSIQYNMRIGYLSFEVGSAITYDSIPEEEYAECLLKAKAMMEVLEGR